MKLANERGICIAYAVTIHRSFGDEFVKKVVNQIISDTKSNVIVLFSQVK